jgi:peptidoglycan/xylan/chitin deacetylase (PgdA/CDA1 family)
VPPSFPDARLRRAGISAARVAQLQTAYTAMDTWQQQRFRALVASAPDELLRRTYDPAGVPDAGVTAAQIAADPATAAAIAAAITAAHDTDPERETFLPARLSDVALRAAFVPQGDPFIRRARGAVCFGWDDGYASHDTIRQLATQLGQRHTFNIISSSPGAGNYMTWAQIKTAFAQGHEIASHSVDHAHLLTGGLSVAQRTAQYNNSKTAIEAQIGAGNCTTYAYAYGGSDRSAATDRELYLRYQRVLDIGDTLGNSNHRWMYRMDNAGRDDAFVIGRFPWSSQTHQQFLGLIRMAGTQPVILTAFAHDLGTAGAPTLAQAQEAMNLAASLGIPCLRFNEAFPGGSLLRDPGFEDPTLSAWTQTIYGTPSGTVTYESIADTPNTGMPGTNSLHLALTNALDGVSAGQLVPLLPNRVYNLSGNVRRNLVSGTGYAAFRLRQRDANGGALGTLQANFSSATWGIQNTQWTTDPAAAWGTFDVIAYQYVGDAWVDHLDLRIQTEGSFG